MIREHPRFQKTAIIFVSAIQMTDLDLLRGYQLGAVDYVPVPVIPAGLAFTSGCRPFLSGLPEQQESR